VSDTPRFALRDAGPEDISQIARIYAHHVLTGLASFEDDPPDEDEMRRRYADVRGRGLPWLIACDPGGPVLGYAYAAPYRPRAAYRFAVEDSIYVTPEAAGRGIGRALLAALEAAAVDRGVSLLLVDLPSGSAAEQMCRRSGFRLVGQVPGFTRSASGSFDPVSIYYRQLAPAAG